MLGGRGRWGGGQKDLAVGAVCVWGVRGAPGPRGVSGEGGAVYQLICVYVCWQGRERVCVGGHVHDAVCQWTVACFLTLPHASPDPHNFVGRSPSQPPHLHTYLPFTAPPTCMRTCPSQPPHLHVYLPLTAPHLHAYLPLTVNPSARILASLPLDATCLNTLHLSPPRPCGSSQAIHHAITELKGGEPGAVTSALLLRLIESEDVGGGRWACVGDALSELTSATDWENAEKTGKVVPAKVCQGGGACPQWCVGGSCPLWCVRGGGHACSCVQGGGSCVRGGVVPAVVCQAAGGGETGPSHRNGLCRGGAGVMAVQVRQGGGRVWLVQVWLVRVWLVWVWLVQVWLVQVWLVRAR